MNVFVAMKCDSWDRNEVLGVFATLEVAKTMVEAEEPTRHFEWSDIFGLCIVTSGLAPQPVYHYSIEEFEVREQ